MFFRKSSPAPQQASELDEVVNQCLPDTDSDTRQIVVAVAGLFGCVSYADRDFSEREARLVEGLLSTIHGIDQTKAQRIMTALKDNIVRVASVEAPRYARALKQLGDRELRLHVLDMLLDVAATDHDLSQAEVVVLRQITGSLGLEQNDYNVLQSKHRTLLAALRG